MIWLFSYFVWIIGFFNFWPKISFKSDIAAFLTTHNVEQAIENVNAIRSKVIELLPGGEKLIKTIYLKSTDSISVPIYMNKSKIFEFLY